MTFLLDEIARLTAANAVALVPTPQAPFGYGRDLVCRSDLTEDMRETDQNSPESIIDWCFRVLTTGRNTIPDAPGQGFDVSRLINVERTRQSIAEIEGEIRNEIDQDDRIERSEVSVAFNNSDKLFISFRIFPEDVSTPDFSFTFALDTSGQLFLESLK